MGINVVVTSPSEKVSALAAYIANHEDKHFEMSNSDYCAYAFAKQCFGVEHQPNTERTNTDALARMLQIPEAEARALYCSTGLNRKEAVEYLHELAERV